MDFSKHDQRKYRTVEPSIGYDEWAEFYDSTVNDILDLPLLNRSRALGKMRKEALDLACGTGRVGAWLKERGVQNVDGLDLSERMLQQANKRGIYRHLKRAEMTKTELPDAAYDLIVNSMAIEHVRNIADYYAETHRLLKEGGVLATIGFHQHFMLSGIPTHFDRPDGTPVAIENYIHLFSDHHKAAAERGFKLLEVDESVVDEAWVAAGRPHWAKYLYKPISYLLVWQK